MKPYVKISGNGANLVLLHGWGLHGEIWQTLLPELELHFRVYNVDLPGFGYSKAQTDDYNLDYVVDNIKSILPEKFHLMGWSLGGLVAMAIAKNLPKQTEKLITVATNPCFVVNSNWQAAMPKQLLQSFMSSLVNNPKRTLNKFLSIQAKGSTRQKQDLLKLRKILSSRDAPDQKVLLGGLQILQETNLVASLSKLTLASLQIYGAQDSLVPIEIAKQVASRMPNSAQSIFTDAAHVPFLSFTEEFCSTVIHFLNEKTPINKHV